MIVILIVRVVLRDWAEADVLIKEGAVGYEQDLTDILTRQAVQLVLEK